MKDKDEIADLLNKIRWNEEHIKFKIEVGFLPKGLVKPLVIPFDRIGFGDKNTEAFMLKTEEKEPTWIPFDRVTDVYKNGLLLWHRDLGQQVEEFDTRDVHVTRKERYYLMRLRSHEQVERDRVDLQFTPDWVTWDEALSELTYPVEREWVRRAREAADDEQGQAGGHPV